METMINKNDTYYLAFESKNIGMMEKLDMQGIKTLIGDQQNCKSVEWMIVSACRSQKIGILMNKLGIPVVIAINAPFKIQDEAARSFGKRFLTSLVQGTNYDEAFNYARRFVATHQKTAYIATWCWAHPHKPNWRWTTKAKEIGLIKAHELHMPTWKCNRGGNLHYYVGRKLCTFVDEFLEEYATWNYYEENKEDPDWTYLWCWSPDMPHDESMKFVFICNEKEYRLKKPFEKLEDGPISIVSPLPTENVPINVGALPPVGRNKVLHNIADWLSYTGSTQTRLVHIYGKEGVGKTFVAKQAAKYLFERRNFDHGWIYIEIKNKYAVGENLSSLIWNAMGIPSTNKQILWK